ncbi:hypothetical protein [Catenuloplanes atrovinosus]|uniref:Uncharacterized protein n=1 Tax=Catenuloplanes atrovinosus TaxID=137266 RepID=A0AAE4CB16_9ACTN|nr:hypothetical protein [Catenuloplanes atrovinosus]MDR7277633.1 hypothetical protein [Catenuloplanes atrovinosus]
MIPTPLPRGVRLPTRLTDAAARTILTEISRRTGWAIAVWNRADAQQALTDLLHPPHDDNPLTPAVEVTDAEWARIASTRAWRLDLRDRAEDAITRDEVLEEALYQAGLICDTCCARLHEPPTVTGYLCPAHRTGPAGQPAVVDPDTATLYWLDDDTLMTGPRKTDAAHRPRAGQPYTGDPDTDPHTHQQAMRAYAALTAKRTTGTGR